MARAAGFPTGRGVQASHCPAARPHPASRSIPPRPAAPPRPSAARVALKEGSLVVNSSQGGGTKDTWVLASARSSEDRELSGAKVVNASGVAAARPAENAPDPLHTQTQQQQQGLEQQGGEH